jgi:ATP-dependent helicase HrpB
VDLRLRVEAIRNAGKAGGPGTTIVRGFSAENMACKQCLTEANHYKRKSGIPETEEVDIEASGILLAFAYPDRIAQLRGNHRFLMSNGRGAVINKQQLLSKASYLVAADLDDQGVDSRIYIAAPVSLNDLEQYFKNQIVEVQHIAWDTSAQAVRAKRRVQLYSLILKETNISTPDPEAICSALIQGIKEEGLDLLPWKRAARQLQKRSIFIRQFDPDWPDLSESNLKESLREWLAPHIYGFKSREDLQGLNLASILEDKLSWTQRRELEALFPTHLFVPSGSRIPIDYTDPETPKLSVRLQEMFGLRDTPHIAQGRVPLTLQLLSPSIKLG